MHKKLVLALGLATVFFIFYYIHDGEASIYVKKVYEQNFSTTTVAKNEELTTIDFVGDIMLSRVVNTKIHNQKNPYFPFQNVRDILLDADIRVGNLESPFRNYGAHNVPGIIFNADSRDAKRLQASGFDILSLANNHILDGGEEGALFKTNT